MQKNRKGRNKQRKRSVKNRNTVGNMDWISGNRKTSKPPSKLKTGGHKQPEIGK